MGIPSTDSDYDVRFYMFLEKNGIGQWKNIVMSLNGRLMMCLISAAGSLERHFAYSINRIRPSWNGCRLTSSMLNPSLAKQLRELKDRAFYPPALMYHYLNMAKRNESRHLRGEQVRIKKYFYVLRPLLACQWIERYRTVPPMDFHKLLEELVEEGPLLAEIHELLKRKMDGEEMDVENRLAYVHPFIDKELARFDELVKSYNQPKDNLMQELNELLQSTLDEVWA